MYYVVETKKSFEQASSDIENEVVKAGFGILHVYNFGEILKSKGEELQENCKVFEICNPKKAAKVMEIDIRLNMALPCRVSVFTENNVTKIGAMKPADMLVMLSKNEEIVNIANEVETQMIKIIDNTK